MNLIKPKYGEAKEIIYNCYKLGMTSRDIRSKYNISKYNINNVLRRLNIKLKPVRPNWGGSRTYANRTH